MLPLSLTEASKKSDKGRRVEGSVGPCDVLEGAAPAGLEVVVEVAAPEKVVWL
jgi:hypothetical protein